MVYNGEIKIVIQLSWHLNHFSTAVFYVLIHLGGHTINSKQLLQFPNQISSLFIIPPFFYFTIRFPAPIGTASHAMATQTH